VESAFDQVDSLNFLRMTFVNYIVGANVNTLERDEVLLETTRRSQEIRTRQSPLSIALAILICLIVVGSLWNRTNNSVLIIWGLAIVALAVWRSLISRRLRNTLAEADPRKLIQNEADLVFTGLAIPLLVGASVWLFGMQHDTEIVLIVMLLCVLCAIGSSLKTVAQRRIQALMVTLNLGQAALFFIICGDASCLAVATLVLVFIALLLVCGGRTEDLIVGVVSSKIEIKNQSKLFLLSHSEKEEALKEAVNANQTKNRFLAAASHDLSQPLHAMSLFINNLKQNFEGDDRQYALVHGIENTANILKQQFDGMLDISRYDAGGVTVNSQPFDLYELCEILVQAERISAEENKVEVSVTGDRVRINSDPVLLGRLIGNLIANAVKFTRQGTVKIDLEQLQDQVILRVTDSGCGFSESESDKIFNDFVQLNTSAHSRNKGVGLGLSIVRRISTLLGVDLKVNSIPGLGSEFILFIPDSDLGITGLHRKGF